MGSEIIILGTLFIFVRIKFCSLILYNTDILKKEDVPTYFVYHNVIVCIDAT